jgi:hypothetical protein
VIDLAELRKDLRYDPATGIFTRLVCSNNKHVAGEICGGPDAYGYICLRYKGKTYKAHRLAWFYVRGVWPSEQIDHKDTNCGNNAFDNLRDATREINQQNQRGTKGYFRDGKTRWRAQIRSGKRSIHLGCFSSEEEARKAYEQAKPLYHPETPRVAA